MDLAISDHAGTRILKVADRGHAGLNTLGNFVYQLDGLPANEEVKLQRLDDLLSQFDIADLHAVKLDVEGAEVAAIRGASRSIQRFKPALLIEVLEAALREQNASTDELLSMLDEMGYRVLVFGDKTGLLEEWRRGERLSANIVALPR